MEVIGDNWSLLVLGLTFAAAVLGLHPACSRPKRKPPNLQRRLESGDFGVSEMEPTDLKSNRMVRVPGGRLALPSGSPLINSRRYFSISMPGVAPMLGAVLA